MTASASGPATERSQAFLAIGWATLIAGVLDISSAFLLSYPKGVGPIRVLHGVAAGLIGRESAINGGLATAGLGLAIHFFIAFVVATVFYVASRKLVYLARHPIISGFLYGVVVYGFMYWIVMPLAYPVVHPSLSRDLTAVCVHMFLIGLPIALIVRWKSGYDFSNDPWITKVGSAAFGAFVGGFIAFLLRPSVMGYQVPFEAVITRGATLSGSEELAVPLAASSFNYLLAGVILGTLLGVCCGHLMQQREGPSNK